MAKQEIPEITEDEKELFLFIFIFIYQYNSNAVLVRSTIHKVHFWIFRLVQMKNFILFYEADIRLDSAGYEVVQASTIE